MRDYGKVHSTFWSSPTTASMTDDGRLLSLYLLTCPHNTIAGVFRLPIGYVAEDLGWGSERVSQGFAELLAKGFATQCEATKWVWVTKHLEWNPPENPNQRKSAQKIAHSIPDECVWKQAFMRLCGELIGRPAAEKEPERANPSATLPQPFLNQEQEQKQEQKQEQEQEKKERKRAPASQSVSVADLVAEGVDAQHAADWIAARRVKHLPLTPTAWDTTKAEALKAGIPVPEAIRLAASNGWAGFKASWIEGANRGAVGKQAGLEARNAAVLAKFIKEQANAVE